VSKFNCWMRASALSVLWATAVVALPAQTVKSLYSFEGSDGRYPYAGLVQGTDGDFYGTTPSGGTKDYGTIFKITSSGKSTTLRNFNGADGANPYAGLVQAADGNFYGTTSLGGPRRSACATGCGTVFKITPSGKLTTLHRFDYTDGYEPYAGFVQGTDGDFYGTTAGGGTKAVCGAGGCGTVFKITPSGKLTTLHSFDKTDGNSPQAGLVQGTDGNFYGTTVLGGARKGVSYGTVFKMTLSGKLTTLHSFTGPRKGGAYPYGGLVQATNGDFYGTTEGGGANAVGTVFRITPSGKLTTLHSFDFNKKGQDGEGVEPYAGLVQGTDRDFYGTTHGDHGDGTIFKITLSGKLTKLWSFDSTDGATPHAGLVQGTDGNFYGTTQYGGSNDACTYGCGTVFSLSVGLGPFVETLPTSGKVGAAVKILGTDLTGATSVSFNGTVAKFKVVSSSEITTTVPAGATTGTVEVKTPGGTLKSNVVFRVTP
jgi:uncharacterized repeat protein (TIGR03803 family)